MNVNENRIREYAYQIWQSEGCPDGQAHRHWEMACKRLKQKRSEPTDATNMTSATPTGKSTGPKSARRKKAELVTDIVNTEMPKI
jgi:hypothetical protein